MFFLYKTKNDTLCCSLLYKLDDSKVVKTIKKTYTLLVPTRFDTYSVIIWDHIVSEGIALRNTINNALFTLYHSLVV
jgi:hypothetical protein